MIWLHILIFLICCFLLGLSSKWLVNTLSRIALFLRLKEFVVGFFLMSFATSLPNFFVGVISALKGIPELSFGDVIGGNIVDLSLVIGLAALFSKNGISALSKTVQGSSIFTIFIAILPLILITDLTLSRADGVLLILSFFIYIFWLFSKKERFSKIYDNISQEINFRNFFKDIIFLILNIIILLISAKGVVSSASVFSFAFSLPIAIIGLFIVGLGNCLPEIFFSIQAARTNENWMILGELMGSVIVISTLVLGIVVLISPIKITDFSPFAVARIFVIISCLFFIFCLKTDAKISKREGIFLIFIYIFFLITEILIKNVL